jgi:N-acetylneuraminic acid mutarotase
MYPTLLASPRRFRPHLEKLEARSQPGSLLTDIAGWSILGQSFTVLQFDPEPDLTAAQTAAAAVDVPAVSRPAEDNGMEALRHIASPSPIEALIGEPESARGQLLAAASVEVTPLEEPPVGIDKIDGTWFTLAPMQTTRQEVSTAVLNYEIYVIAGFTSAGASTRTVEVYNPATNEWRFAADLPIANNHNAAAVAAGTLYAFGGVSNRVFAYWPEKDVWYDVAPMNYQHGNTAAVAVIDDLIYVAGGTGPGMVGNEVEVYDPYKNTWTILPPMNVPRNHTAGGNLFGYFVVAAGRGSPGSTTAFELYDPASGKWYVLPNLPTGRSGVGGAVVDNCFYVFGGEMPGVFPHVEVFDPFAWEWRRATDMPTPRHGIFAATIDNFVFIPGGGFRQGLGATNVHEVFFIG